MLLTIDVGNTNMLFGFFQEEQLCHQFRLTSKERRTADELGLLLMQYLHSNAISVSDIDAVVIASVVPSVMPMLLRAVEVYLQQTPLIMEQDIHSRLCYHNSHGRLGADRAVCCDAAIEQYGTPCLVVDLGTATTLDAVGDDNLYLGGCILAGMHLSAQALASKTDLLPEIALEHPDTFLGYNTIEQMQIGAVSGYIGGIDYLLRQTLAEMGGVGHIVATGGLAQIVAAHLPLIDTVDDNLMLEGMRLAYVRHQKDTEGR